MTDKTNKMVPSRVTLKDGESGNLIQTTLSTHLSVLSIPSIGKSGKLMLPASY